MDNPAPNPQNWPNLSNQDNRPKPPPPPPPEITLRTMKSDLESLKQTGGASPTPKPFTPPEIKNVPVSPPPAPAMPQQPQAPKMSPTNFPFQQKPAEKTVSLGQFAKDDLSKIGAPKPAAALPQVGTAPESSKKKKLIILITVLLVVGTASALLGYFVIFPKFFPAKTTPPVSTTSQIQETQQPAETEQTSATEIPITHVSLLSTAGVSTAANPATDLASLKNSIKQESLKTSTNDSLVEILIKDLNGSALPANKILSLMIPELSAESVIGLEDDCTLALYYDANGVWPVYAFKIKADFTASQIQNSINGIIEMSSSLKNLFISDPGTSSGIFKAGVTNGTATRYLTFSQKGASLNLVWKNDKFIISASYNGTKKILGSLK